MAYRRAYDLLFGTMVPMYHNGAHDDSTQTASSTGHRGRTGPDRRSPGEAVAESAEGPGRIPRPVARRPARRHRAARAREQAALQVSDTGEDRRPQAHLRVETQGRG